MESNTAHENIKSTPTESKALKCVVWDLDHTMWHGVLIENDDLTLRHNIKTILKTLDERGVLLSIASKNNHDDAMAKLKAFGIEDYFLYPQINWGPKSESLKNIQEKLNIGMDAIAFIDDQSFEREEVAFANKEALCLDVDVIETILDRPEFKPRFITIESAKRRQMYLDDDQRKNEEVSFEGPNIDFLASQEMEFTVSPATVEDLQRVEELTVRTNQLNASGYTYAYEELESFIVSPHHQLFVAELSDKYGSYGKIGVALVECISGKWTLKSMLMSCRVMSRGVGNVLLFYMMNLAKTNHEKLYTEFLHTDRNRLMYMTLKFAGFTETGQTLENGRNLLVHELKDDYNYPNYLKLTLK